MPMVLADYHLHTDYSFDGHESVDEVCARAFENHLDEISITDHLDIYSDRTYESVLDLHSLFRDIRRARWKYRGSLEIAMGVELGQPMVNPPEYKRFMRNYTDLDFIIGSVHNIVNDTDVADLDLNLYSPPDVFERYFGLLMDYAVHYDYDVLGHITYPLRYFQLAGKDFDIAPYYSRIKELFSVVIARGRGIELNVSGLRQNPPFTMPPADLLRIYYLMGGRILTFGSDAHYLRDIGHGIEEGHRIAREAGFTSYTTFWKRHPIYRDL